jgi:cytochrome c553
MKSLFSPRIALPAVAAVFALSASSATRADDPRVRVWAASCAACHGTGGSAQTGIPPIAGQDKAVLQQKLLAYKAGTLPATVMHQHAKGYTDEELAHLAEHFARQPK